MLKRSARIIYILIFMIIFIHLFLTVNNAFFQPPEQGARSGVIVGFTILLDVTLLIANQIVLQRILYGFWTMRRPKLSEKAETVPLRDLINKDAFPFLVIWVAAIIILFPLSFLGPFFLYPEIFIKVCAIIAIIGLVAGTLFALKIFRNSFTVNQ